MNWASNRALRTLFRLPLSAAQVARDVDDELKFHFESRVADLVARGSSPIDAQAIAEREFGDVAESKAELAALDRRMVTRQRRMNMLHVLRHDLVYALRGLRRSPGLTLTIIITLGLGVGANAAVFTALDRLFFQAPPGVVDAGAVRHLHSHKFSASQPWFPDGSVRETFNLQEYFDLENASRATAQIEGEYIGWRSHLQPSKDRVFISFVTPGFFSMLGVHAVRGRLFAPDENRLSGTAVPVAVISEQYWRTHFASDSGIVGKTMNVDDAVYTIVGVVAAFEGTQLQTMDMWAPLANQEGGLAGVDALTLFARTRAGTDIPAFDKLLTRQFLQTHAADKTVEQNSTILTSPFLAARAPANAPYAVNGLPPRSRLLVTRIAGMGMVVLLISITNVASLLLMRAIRRRHEIAVRLALGVSRARLIAQLLTESVILALAAAVVSLAIAYVAGGMLRAALSAARWTATIVDTRVVVFALTIAVVSGVLAGLAPAFFALRADVGSLLKTSSSVGQRSSTGVRTALLATQASLCMVLLASAGLFVQSLRRAGDVNRGFDSENTVQISVRKASANPELELKQIADRLRALPNIVDVGRPAGPLNNSGISTKVGPTYQDTIGQGPRGPLLEFVEPEFMRTMGMSPIGGRAFSSADNFAFVAILNESLARALWPKGDVLGRCVHVREPQSPCRTIVGVVRDVVWDVTEPSKYRVYVPLTQAWILPPTYIPNYLYARTRSPATMIDVAAIWETATSVVQDASDVQVTRTSSAVEPLLQPWRLAAKLFFALGMLGLLSAGICIYGLVNYDVAQRSREFGVRVALGATSLNILRLVLTSGARAVGIGIAAGIIAAVIAGRVLSSLLYDTAPYDWQVLAVTATTLIVIAVLASVWPAVRAARIDPMAALATDI